MIPQRFEDEILSLLAPRTAGVLSRAVSHLTRPLEEIRLREGRALHLVLSGRDTFVTPDGLLTADPSTAEILAHDEISRTFQRIAQGSVYAWEDEVRSGFITVEGGHRVGLCGRAVTEDGRIRTLKQIAGLNIRIAREVRGAADHLLPRLLHEGRLCSTLLISPPQAGKTTILRDLVRQISTGVPPLNLWGMKVGLVDERSEVAGCLRGVPQRDLGPRTDVLDGCPKAEGMMLLIRALSPAVVAVDEIGRPADADAVMEALHAGVVVLATAHGHGLGDISRRPALAALLQAGAFQRAVILGRDPHPGAVQSVIDLEQEVAAC